MKIILSPAKTLNLENPINQDWHINELTAKIADVLRKQTGEDLKQVLKISDKLVEENLEYIQAFAKNNTSVTAVKTFGYR